MNLTQRDFSFSHHAIQSEAPADFHRVKLEAVPSPFPKRFSERHPFRLQTVLMVRMVSEGTMATSFEHV